MKTLFAYSLMGELLVLLFIFLAFLMTAEILLPGFISLRLNLTWYLFLLLVGVFLLLLVGKISDIQPIHKIPLERGVVTLSSLWGVGIIGLSLYRFPWWSILILLGLLALVSVWAYQILYPKNNA